MISRISKSTLCLCLMIQALAVSAEDISCTGKIQSVTTIASRFFDDRLVEVIAPIPDSRGNILALSATFTSGDTIQICGLEVPYETGAGLDISLDNFDFSDGRFFTEEEKLEFQRDGARIFVAPQLCQQWFASAQMALALDLDLTLRYPEETLDSCDSLSSDNLVVPTSLTISR